MDKYIGNKKAIVDGIYDLLVTKGTESGLFIDVFSGTTNVGQYFKQRDFSIVSNDISEMSFVLGKAYIENNSFPKYRRLITTLKKEGFEINIEEQEKSYNYIKRKIDGDKTFSDSYYSEVNYETGITPLLQVLQYLNSVDTDFLNEEESLFLDHYTIYGEKSGYRSSRGTEGKRNYFTKENAKRLGKILALIKRWKQDCLVNDMEFYILLACVLEEVTLNANVNGTFHDFNRNKLYPNAEARFHLKPILLNIVLAAEDKKYMVFRKDSNELYKDRSFSRILGRADSSVLYIDPPYNFRQYSAYYHMLNFIARYHEIENVLKYADGFEFVRGQNMIDNYNSDYCYKDRFISSLENLVNSIKAKEILISYYDENNHWNHGKTTISLEGRTEIVGIFKRNTEISFHDEEPHSIPRINYQSRGGEHKKQIEELLFYARR